MTMRTPDWMYGWMPIETAPKDGTVIWVATPWQHVERYGIRTAQYDSLNQQWVEYPRSEKPGYSFNNPYSNKPVYWQHYNVPTAPPWPKEPKSTANARVNRDLVASEMRKYYEEHRESWRSRRCTWVPNPDHLMQGLLDIALRHYIDGRKL